MTYTRTWDETQPKDPGDADLINQSIRNLKIDMRERMDSILSTVSNWESGAPIQLADAAAALGQNFTPAGPGTITLDLSLYRVFQGTISGACIFVISNVPSGSNAAVVEFYLFIFKNIGVTITWPTGTVWASAAPPTLADGYLHYIKFTTVDAGVHWIGQPVGNLG